MNKHIESIKDENRELKQRIAELEHELTIKFLEGKLEGVDKTSDYIDGYYASAVTEMENEIESKLKALKGKK